MLRLIITVAALAAACLACGCTRADDARARTPARNLVLITIDTLRADRLGVYGHAAARTPVMDGLASRGVRFDNAFATAPVTLPSHASLLTGLYPPGHGARHNGIRVDPGVPTLTERLAQAGFATGGFVAAFPLDRRFGLARGFTIYSDRMPRGAGGRLASERPGRVVVDEALEWLAANREGPFFLWVHLFEPHAPYGDPSSPAQARRPALERYDDEIAEADRQVGRIVEALGGDESTTIVVTADHGEAFGEHGEIAHSIFVYDTTLRIPLILAGAGIPSGRVVTAPVALVDIAPTAARLLRVDAPAGDGLDLGPVMAGGSLPDRELYAESFAPLLDFGWSALRTLRSGGWKFIAAPRPELYEVSRDPAESENLIGQNAVRAAKMAGRVDAVAGPELAREPLVDREAAARLSALGYVSASRSDDTTARPDPKDRREEAARIARVVSGELDGAALEATLREILRDDPDNSQANLRLGHLLLDAGRCGEAHGLFARAIAAHMPTADAHLGLAACQASSRDFRAAEKTLREAELVEPDNPVVIANLGVVLSDSDRPAEAVAPLERALALDPDFHQARFNLALAFARRGQRAAAEREATELLRRMPAAAPQRPEVERLLRALQP